MKVLVLAGGNSAERNVSLQSGSTVALALTFTGKYIADLRDPAEFNLLTSDCSQWDIAFPMVHGTGGEDGVLQRQLGRIGLMYVGSNAEASELTFDKIRTNQLLSQHGITVPPEIVLQKNDMAADNHNAIIKLGLPVVVKPPRQGSSIGVSIVQTAEQIAAALSLAFEYDEECLVEQYIDGAEVTVTVIDGKAYPAIEIRPATEWYDYDSKYADNRTQYIIDTDNTFQTASDIAVKACEICGVTGIARVDVRIDTLGGTYLLEVNTIPGMTSHSLVPKSAAAAGLSMSDLCDLAIQNRLQRLP